MTRSLLARLLVVVSAAALVGVVPDRPADAAEYGLGSDFNDTAIGAMPPGWSAAGAVDGATVRLSTVGRSERANGVKFGTASVGPFRNVVVEDVLVKHTGVGTNVATA